MKKFIILAVVCMFVINGAFARDVSRKIIKNATVKQVQPVVLDTISLYDGVISIKEINKEDK